jgi:Tfp pilus assembly protein PilV
MKINKINQFGDTIVEVLIVASILAATLGGAFAIANRSNKGVQANKERHQAQLIANSQVERIRSTIDVDANRQQYKTWNTMSKGCIDVEGVIPVNPTNNCKTANGDSFSATGLYNVSIECVGVCDAASTYNTFKIRIEWDSITGGDSTGKDNVELYYGA